MAREALRASLPVVSRPPATALPVTLIAIAIAAALAGCGEKGEPPTTGPVVEATTTSTGTDDLTGLGDDPAKTLRLQASKAAVRFLTSPDARAVCDGGVTPGLLRKLYADRAGCLADRRSKLPAGSATVGEVRLEGEGGATVDARAKGGIYGGKALKLILVRDGAGAWRVDSIR